VICPHCRQNLKYKERPGRKCSKCRRPFALEPKASPLGLNDMRIGKLAERLSDRRGLRYTTVQLWYAAGWKKLPRARSRSAASPIAIAVISALAFVFAFLVCLLAGLQPLAALILGGVGAAGVLLTFVTLRAAVRAVGAAPIRIRVGYESFEREVAGRWAGVYGGPPPGCVDPRGPLPAVNEPRLALLCPDRSVLSCLAANDASQSRAMVLTDRIEHIPPDLPVIVLHDASLPGLLFADSARAALGPRAVVAGLAPRTVMASRSPMRLREDAPPPEELARLRRESLAQEEIDWLAEGWWSPIAAVPPAKLLSAVDRSVQQIEEMSDPDRRRALAVGFLTWPAP
jgi:hypothetical protein